jgi:hypothetical protein
LKSFATAVVLALGLLAAAGARAADIFTGHIGAAEVVVALHPPSDGEVGVYFYRRVGGDIHLQGAGFGDGSLTFREGSADTTVPSTGAWRVARNGATITGQWQATATSAAQPVELHLLASTPPDALVDGPGGQENNVTAEGEPTSGGQEMLPYNLERARTPVTLGPVQALGAGAYQMATDPRTHVYWPRLVRFPDATAMARLNAVFEQNRALAIAEAQDCVDSLMESPRTGAPNRRPMADVATVRVTHLGARLISLTLGGSIDCGGAHPSNFFANVTYDASGRLYDPAQLLRLDTAARRAAFARAWQPLMRARMAANPQAIIRECLRLTGDDGLLPVTYRLSEHGLVVTEYNDSGAGAACNQDLAELSLAQLAPFLAPGAAAKFN